ncbi:iron compound ABC transporter ironcompound-binding protein [Striga asiatica]|uniref:Iron compound ABC transporter ironcompound-binding protein n=1 Tax=Striga asiatica TaxID=4170 RepID=A0A5A7P2L3_STRAF|nr:iron compound ABC transporter ironcompound-binding protein [Striga asiatica]
MNTPQSKEADINFRGVRMLTDKLEGSNPSQPQVKMNLSLVESSSSRQENQSSQPILITKEPLENNKGKEIINISDQNLDQSTEMDPQSVIKIPTSTQNIIIKPISPLESSQSKLKTWKRTGTKVGRLQRNQNESTTPTQGVKRGRTIRLQDFHWVPGIRGRALKFKTGQDKGQLRVNELFTNEGRWDEEKIRAMFDENDCTEFSKSNQ